jgi:hypothetical protein
MADRIKKLLRSIREGHKRISQIRDRNHARRRTIRHLERSHHPEAMVMFDSVTVAEIPKSAPAVAGYVGGSWPTYEELPAAFPHAHLMSIAVSSAHKALCLDVEPGDATNASAIDWARRELAARPMIWVYTSVSNVDALLAALRSSGIDLSRVLVWSAHYTFRSHLCGPSSCGECHHECDATQWTDHSQGRNLDESIVSAQGSRHLIPPQR